MKITKFTTVQHIFNVFNTAFPYLKLEFYTHSHADGEGSRKEDQLSHNTLISTLNPSLHDTIVEFDEEMTVADLEKLMKEKYKLNIQVFRKSSDLWLQTTATDHWTLGKQNGKGQRSTVDYEIEPIDITDFDAD